ncbi:type III-B CRISPR module-associated protein Cmr3 [Caloranaerobacter azorensis]|uniref:Type III-B CRISPR module-associated protein Cmr3 n=1 Tax=Caloranaerobacter azorensis TaxID=116090 RepID=A0A6P1YEV4_9FIRM|nr:type III-B CRISPR module-associated protein Cmr3 [Caloranaerobacter azorensis]QIB27288.1 type III-B CRISPR module-associated protein Cmr3 [Caloranaerobacter azorensis]
MIIEIIPLDPLFFRDGRSFTAGEDTWASSLILPYPSVIYGALRTAYFSNHPEELKYANTEEDPTKELKIKNILYKSGSEVYYPIPLDCLKEKYSKEKDAFTMKLVDNEIISNLRTEKRLEKPDEGIFYERINDGLLNYLNFKNYIYNTEKSFIYSTIADFVLREPKIGIARDKTTRSSKEGRLYRINMMRWQNTSEEKLGILVDFEGIEIPEEGIIKLGGEGRAARYKKPEESEVKKINVPNIEEDIFKMYFATPTFFKNGWLASWIDIESYEGYLPNTKVRVKLVAAAIGQFMNIGGFSIKGKNGKPYPKYMHRMLPPGSVYFLRILDGDKEELKNVHLSSVSDVRSNEGFGICYIGKI